MGTNLALAESPSFEPEFESRPDLYLVPDCIDQAADEAALGQFINADSIPELSFARQRAAQNATMILSQNRSLLHNGAIDQVPTPVDALGTAKQVVEARQKYGEDSTEYKEIFSGLVLDSERLVGEAATKNRPEHFASVLQEFRPASNEYFSHGLSISRMTENGLTPLGEVEEQDRRVGEYVEEDGTYVPIGRMIANEGLRSLSEKLKLPVELDVPKVTVEVTTVSECTDFAEQGFIVDSKGSYGGYRPGMKGIAVRRVHFEDDSGDRYEEQVIISGIYITHDLIEGVLAEKGAIEQDQKLTKTELHGSQFLSVGDGSVMEFVRELDEKAGEVHHKNLFMGEEVADNYPKDYDEFIEEADDRRKKLAPMPTQLAELLVDLEEKGTESQAAESLVNNFLKEKLLAIAKENPELAEAMFDKETAEGFTKVAQLKAEGKHDAARTLQLEVEENAPEASYCGAGSCGLESVDVSSPAFQAAREIGLKGKLLHDKERSCPNCNQKKVHYGDNGKACIGCGHNDVGGGKKT